MAVAVHEHPAIELSGLTKRYRRGKGLFTAADDVTLSVPAGLVLGLLGPNGAGKTTTIKMICGLITPSAGTIRLNGHDVARQRPSAVRQIGAVLEGSRCGRYRQPALLPAAGLSHALGRARRLHRPGRLPTRRRGRGDRAAGPGMARPPARRHVIRPALAVIATSRFHGMKRNEMNPGPLMSPRELPSDQSAEPPAGALHAAVRGCWAALPPGADARQVA
jgi:ABC transporter